MIPVLRGDIESLFAELYPELRLIAGRLVRGERPGHTLQRTALVHEAFLRLLRGLETQNLSRESFLRLAGHQMRMILVDYARRHRAQRRWGSLVQAPLFESEHIWERDEDEFLALNGALDRMGAFHPRAASVVELKFFAGFTYREIAAVLDISETTVESDWAYARAWLFRELTKRPAA
jgi:RNA polymerase sigma-70 factor, ECF subfamily